MMPSYDGMVCMKVLLLLIAASHQPSTARLRSLDSTLARRALSQTQFTWNAMQWHVMQCERYFKFKWIVGRIQRLIIWQKCKSIHRFIRVIQINASFHFCQGWDIIIQIRFESTHCRALIIQTVLTNNSTKLSTNPVMTTWSDGGEIQVPSADGIQPMWPSQWRSYLFLVWQHHSYIK